MVVLDGIALAIQQEGGVSRYWSQLCQHMLNSSFITKLLLHDAYLQNGAARTLRPPAGAVLRDSNISLLRRVSPVAVKHGPERFIFHSSYFRICSNPHAINVVTIYDFIAERYWQWPRRFVHHALKLRAMKRADAVIAISETTATDCRRYLPGKPVQVIHLAADECFSSPVVGSEGIAARTRLGGRPYVLYVGSRVPRKNFGCVPAALQQVPDLGLCIIGGGPLTRAEISLLDTLVPERWTQVEAPASEQLASLYRQAYCFVYPSFYEGFGIPIIEAQKAEVPVVASDTPCFREVGGNAFERFDPHQPADLRAALLRVRDPVRRECLVQAGRQNVCRFSWEQCTASTEHLYQHLLTQACRHPVPSIPS